MEAARKFLKVDYYIQNIIGIPCLAFSLVFWGIILLIPFGIWQVISSLVLVFGYSDKKRIPHLVFVAVWTIILTLLLAFDLMNNELFFGYIIFLPAGIGIWYYIMTRRDYLAIRDGKLTKTMNLEDILDVEI